MKKNLALVVFITASSLIAAKSATGLPRPNFSYPTASAPEKDQLVCYMRTADGRTLNLTRLCTRSAPRPQVVISGVVRQDGMVMGNVANQTGRDVRDVKVNYEILDRQGRVVERDAALTEPQNLRPGQTAMFEAIADEGQTIRTVSVNWNE